jgi:hypothetical protein
MLVYKETTQIKIIYPENSAISVIREPEIPNQDGCHSGQIG